MFPFLLRSWSRMYLSYLHVVLSPADYASHLPRTRGQKVQASRLAQLCNVREAVVVDNR